MEGKTLEAGGGGVYNFHEMYIRTLLAVGCGLGMMCGVTLAEQPAKATETLSELAQPVESVENVLEAMLKTQDDNYYELARLLYDSTQDILALEKRMTELSEKSAHPVADVWVARKKIATAHDRSDIESARDLMKRAADSGYVPAMVDYASLLFSEAGGAEDENNAKKYLMEACKQGNSRARAAYLAITDRLADTTYSAPEVASELKKGNYHLEELIAMRQVPAQAAVWLRKAGEHGSPGAAFTLSQSSAELGVSAQESYEWLVKASERKFAPAMRVHGMLLMLVDAGKALGLKDVESDPVRGMRLLHMAAVMGDPEAMSYLIRFYLDAAEDKQLTAKQFYELCAAAHNHFSAPGTVLYAHCLMRGHGCEARPEEGLSLLEEGMYSGVALAALALADVYYNGYGVESDVQRAVDMLGEYAALGGRTAYTLMAALTAMGNDKTPADPVRATMYLKMADERGEANAKAIYEQIVKDGEWRAVPKMR